MALKNFHLFGYPRATWGSGAPFLPPPPPPLHQTWRLYGTGTVLNRLDRISLFNWLIFFNDKKYFPRQQRSVIADWDWHVVVSTKKFNSPLWTKVWTPNQKFVDPLACERQTFLLAHRRWGTFREDFPLAAMCEEKRLPFAGYGSSPVQKLQAIVGLRNTCFENWTWMERSSRNF